MSGHSPTVRIGPSGWDHPSWDRLVYPRKRSAGFHPLPFLASWFDTVEIHSRHSGPLRPEVAQLWARLVERNPRFRFTARVSRRFTHDQVVNPREIAAFADGLRPLLERNRFGCLLMQFPWTLRYGPESRELVIQLRRRLSGFSLAAEMRHESWMRPEALGLFIDYHVGFVNIDQPAMMRALPATAFLTTSIGCARLLGRRLDQATRSPRPDYLYSLAELEEWKARLGRFAHLAESTYVIFDNSAGGRSIVNALQFECLMGGAPRRVPPALSRRWRGPLSALADCTFPQHPLFEETAAA